MKNEHHLLIIPHRAVIRENRATTELGVVFGASSCSMEYTSFEENLEAGRIFNENILFMLINFRK